MNIIEQMYRYPVKGLSGEPLSAVTLIADCGFPLDRKFALTNGTWGFQAEGYQPRPKTDFITLMQYEALAALQTAYQEADNRLVITAPDGAAHAFTLHVAADREALSSFMVDYLAGSAPGKPEIVTADNTAFTDVSVVSASMMNAISLINLSSMHALEEAVGTSLHPMRFRANIYFNGATPWEELGWVGKEIRIGQARAKITLRTRRCAATNVNPETAQRDLGIPQALIKRFRHGDLGVYAEIIDDGAVELGDSIAVL